MVPDIPGAELGITSDGFFELERLPKRVAVVGSGYIAVELAGVLRAHGSEVALSIRHDALLRHFDAMLGEKLLVAMRAAGIDVITTMNTRALTRDGDLISLEAADGRTFGGFDTVLWAVGRIPNVADIGLERLPDMVRQRHAGVWMAAAHQQMEDQQCETERVVVRRARHVFERADAL